MSELSTYPSSRPTFASSLLSTDVSTLIDTSIGIIVDIGDDIAGAKDVQNIIQEENLLAVNTAKYIFITLVIFLVITAIIMVIKRF